MEQPAASSISASASTNGKPRRMASRRPIEVLPAPINPTNAIRRPRSESGIAKASLWAAMLRDMIRKASTCAVHRATPGHPSGPGWQMPLLEMPLPDIEESRRVRVRVLIIVVILVLAVVGGLVVLGLN